MLYLGPTVILSVEFCISMFINLCIARPVYHFFLIYTCGLTVVIKRICYVTLCYVTFVTITDSGRSSIYLNDVRSIDRVRSTRSSRNTVQKLIVLDGQMLLKACC